MAYYCVQATCASAATLLTGLGTALVTMGWTLHDDVSSTQKVYKSNGEDGDQPYGYVEMYISGGDVKFRVWLYWNAVTHTGSNKIVIITSGTGVGQTRKITSNTGTELTVATAWDTVPGADSTYYIVDEAYRVLWGAGGNWNCIKEVI